MSKKENKENNNQQVLPLILILVVTGYCFFQYKNLKKKLTVLEQVNNDLVDQVQRRSKKLRATLIPPNSDQSAEILPPPNEIFEKFKNSPSIKRTSSLLCAVEDPAGERNRGDSIILRPNGDLLIVFTRQDIYKQAQEHQIGKYKIKDPLIHFSIKNKTKGKAKTTYTVLRGIIYSVSNSGKITGISVGHQTFAGDECSKEDMSKFLTGKMPKLVKRKN